MLKSSAKSCDLPPKIYQQQTLRWSSPPGYRSGLTLPGGLCLALLPARAPTTETLSFKRQVAEPIKKHESQVVCSSGGFGAFRTQLCKSNRPVTSEPESDKRELSSPACVTSCMLGSPDHEAWSTEWQHHDHTAMGDLRASSSIDATLGTTAHSWHTTSTASFDAAAAATSAAAAIQPQLITAAVCGQPAQRDEASLSSSECDSRPSPESQPVCDSLKRAQLSGPDISEPTIATMRDECEPSVPSFSRRRRYKVREGQSKSSGASCSNVDTLNAKVNDGTPLSASEHSSEPSSPGSMRDCDSSEPTSPLNAETNLPNSWPVAETENASSASGACSVPISVDENHDEAGKVSNADDDAQDEEDVPAVVEGKFKHLLQYKETVRKLSYAAEDAYDPSITTVIQLDENELSEPEEDVSLHDEVDQHELDEKLNRLQIETPEMNVQQPSDESSRDSSADPVEEDLSLRIKRSSSLKCGKTPPGTPGTKKIVRFADSLGLDLAECRTFLEGVPNVPKSAFGDLRIAKAEDESENSPSSSQLFLSSCNSNRYTAIAQKKMLMPLFQQPCVLPGFLDRVRANKVSLETISVGDDMSVRGYVRVLNLDFHKHVVVRYTFDGWRNFHEVLAVCECACATASYVHGSCDGFSDKFSFLLWGSFLQENGSLTFCIRYTAGGSEFWDNNRGSNYVLQCYTNQIRRQLHQQALHQPADNNLSHGGGSYSKHFGSVFQNSPPTPSENWTGTFF
ncbi:hypothetical protein HAZT_HAZT006465 [Hyalella azteca]|uniref:CBM21 domain-containing protein n=1 Tax=Hyalella azteca TaxID=294128 RepID=A0A6A0HHF1_HYAAZ|nr:hypothetical protein HAZT_HAZT006465 [Hyalella azteca]